MYQIISNTSNTITVQGVFNTTYIQVGNNFTVIYGQLVKDYVNSMYVKFFRDSGANSFADGDATYDGICEVCHTQTTYHRNNASGDHTHQAATNCATCHPHVEGFKASCNACHGYPPVDAGTLVFNPAPTGSATAGTHNLHVNTKGYTCSVCHVNSVGLGVTHNDNTIQAVTMGFSLFSGAYLGGIYNL